MGCLLIWNVRDLNKANKKRYIRELCSMNKVEMCCLLETKLNSNNVSSFVNKFLFVGTILITLLVIVGVET